MLSDALLRVLLLCLLALPAAAAAVVGLLGPRRLAPIRWLSLAASVGTLVLALVLAWQLCVRRAESAAPRPAGMFTTFYPEFVPGAPGESGNRHATSWTLLRIGPGAVQFYIGLDGLN